jgi:hypothetical protein
METKFIEGTNNQYSIREDGNVIQHYKLTWTGKITKIGIDRIMPKYGKNKTFINLCINGKNNGLTINTLLIKYFNIKHCIGCNCKLNDFKRIKCDKCIDNYNKNYNSRKIKTISRTYTADKLNIPLSELSDDLYNHYKLTLKLKRKISKKHNISLHKLK